MASIRLLSIALAGVLLAGAGLAKSDAAAEGGGPAAASAALQSAFAAYKAAARADDGDRVVKLVSAASLAHYDALRRAARDGSLHDAGPRLVDRMQAQMIARLIPAERLAAMSGAETVAWAFTNRMLGEDLEESSALDEIAIDGDAARARHVARGRPLNSPYREVTLRFVREQGEWRLDLLHTLDVMDLQMKDLAKLSGVSEEKLSEHIVGTFTGETLRDGAEALVRASAPTRGLGAPAGSAGATAVPAR